METKNLNWVVGSGPAAVACAAALVDQGHEVAMLDAGLELEPERQRVVTELASQAPAGWKPESVSVIKENMAPDTSGVPLKYVYGSDFPYRLADEALRIRNEQCALKSSLAQGGFSNTWGAGVLPYTADEIADWPMTVDQLAPHYQAVTSMMNVSAVQDDLASRYPLHTSTHSPLRTSCQAVAMLKRLQKHRQKLAGAGISFGQARLAVRAVEQDNQPGCAYCGLCMYGCPYGLIYSSAQTLKRLRLTPNFKYVSGFVCRKVSENAQSVKIEADALATGKRTMFEGQRVFLGCGALSTTRILMESMGIYDRPINMIDSQYFLIPLLRYAGNRRAVREDLHTLCQLFLEIHNPGLSAHALHLSVYTYNELFLQAIQGMFGPMKSLLRPVAEEVAGRLVLCGGYLHSSESPGIELVLGKPEAGKPGLLTATGKPDSGGKQRIRRLAWQLFRLQRQLGAAPAFPMIQMTPPGRGFHSGGTFPMSSSPSSDLQTDLFGRPAGMQRIHAVDTSVFPTIPSGPVTLSIMANAHRIGSFGSQD